MKILSIIAFAGAALGLQMEQASSSKGVDFLGRNGKLSSDYLKKVADTVNSERKTAVNKEITSADKMMKYYQNIIDKSKKNLKEIRGIRAGPKRAMMDLNSKFHATSYWDNNWKNPRLDSRFGVHNHRSQSGKPQSWTVDFPTDKSKTWEVSQFIYKKRGDTGQSDQFPTAVQVEYYDGKSW